MLQNLPLILFVKDLEDTNKGEILLTNLSISYVND